MLNVTYQDYYSNNKANKVETENTGKSFHDTVIDLKSTRLVYKNIVNFIEKNGGFSSLSKEDEILFRKILEDDKISDDEWQKISYEQAERLNAFMVDIPKRDVLLRYNLLLTPRELCARSTHLGENSQIS